MAYIALFPFTVYHLFYSSPKSSNPFKEDVRLPRRPYIRDQKERDKLIKQSFSRAKIPSNLHAIVVGSGPAGLTAAATLSKAGKKVII